MRYKVRASLFFKFIHFPYYWIEDEITVNRMGFRFCVIVLCTLPLLSVGSIQSFNYKDEIAQGACTSIIPDTKPDHVYAVRRTCPSSDTCETVCKNIGKICYNALHMYTATNIGAGETSKEVLHSYRYNSCTGTGCGPNFCCCANHEHPAPDPLAYKDEIAQSTCTAILPGNAAHVYAVRRTCSSQSTETCASVCSSLSQKCFNALHVYNAVVIGNTDTGKVGLHTYRYNSCENTGCGPNFCCCSK